MKKFLLTLFAVVLAAALAACGGKEKAENADDSAATEESKTLTFGATAGPYSDMLKKQSFRALKKKAIKWKLQNSVTISSRTMR